MVVLVSSTELTKAQTSTFNNPWPGSSHTYSFGANAAGNQSHWYVTLDATGANPIVAAAGEPFTLIAEGSTGTVDTDGILKGTEINTLRINWGSTASGTYYVFLNVEDAVSNCSNLKGYKVIVSSTFNAIAANVTGGANKLTGVITAGDITVDGCPDDSSNPIANDVGYTLGSTELAFKVSRSGSMNNWQLGYNITGATVTNVLVKDVANADVGTPLNTAAGTSAVITGTNDYVIVYVTVDNVENTAQNVVFNLVPADSKDVDANVVDDGSHGDDTVSYNIKLIPIINGFTGS